MPRDHHAALASSSAGCLIALLLVVGCSPGEERAGRETAGGVATAPDAVEPWLEDASADLGLDFVHETGATGELLFPEMAGSGVAVLDADGDGRLDLLLVSGAPRPGEGELPVHRLYRGTDGGFVDVTADAGLGGARHGMGVAVGDYDNDGHQDVYLTALGPDRLLRGRGDGSFEEVTADAGVDVPGWSTSAAFCDLDADGHLDLYVARYVVYDRAVRCADNAGRPDYCGPESYDDEVDVLLRNRGDGTFADVTAAAGVDAVTGSGLGVVCEDFDDDGRTDVYVANDGDPNQMWINRGGLRFRDEALLLGTGVNAQGLQEAGMGVLAADFDNDLDHDLFLTHLRDEHNTVYRNLGAGLGFEDRSVASGMAAVSMAFTGFGTAALDIELDGDLDVVIVNGRVRRAPPLEGALPEAPWNAYAEPDLFLLNDGEGSFRPAGAVAAPFTGPVDVGRGLATGDLDRDGDLDLVVSHTQGPARIWRNRAPRAGHWLLVDARDPALGRRALGARVIVRAGGRAWLRTVQGASSYLSTSDPRAHFGLGPADTVDEIVVRWPDGSRETFPGGPADRALVLSKGDGSPAPPRERE